MTTELEHELLRIALACRRTGPDTFVFADGPEINATERLQDYSPEDVLPDVDPLVQVLTGSIYFQCYVRLFEGRSVDIGGDGANSESQSDDILRRLQAANHSQFRWDPGWEVCLCGHDGEVQVKKGDVHRVVVPGEFALDAGPGIRPEEGDIVTLQVFPDSLRLQRGYYYALGEEVPDDFDNFGKLRFYFHIAPDDAPTLVESFTRDLNRYQVPFLFKCPIRPDHYDRIDTAVLYVSHRFFDVTAQIIAALAQDRLSHLPPRVPLFSRTLWPGIGFAEDPQDGSSFGMHRCRLVAEGIVYAWQLAETPTDEQFRDCIRQRFDETGISLTTPWLNAGTKHDYQLTEHVAAVARPRTAQCPPPGVGRYEDQPHSSADCTDRTRFLAAADRIASRLCRDAIWSNGACNWMGWSSALTAGGWNPVYSALGPQEDDPLAGVNLYRGTAGIVRFLTRLETVDSDAIRRRTLIGVLNQIREQSFPDAPIGFYCGSAGVYDTLIEAGRLLEDQDLVDLGVSGLARIADIAPAVSLVDITHGAAGLIPLLLKRAAEFDRSDLYDSAVRHGQRLLSAAVQSAEGWSWDTLPETVSKHLTGFSHGASGVAFALLELHRATGESVYLEAACQGMRYERNHFHKPSRNWIDLRPGESADGSKVKCLTVWCHGAPGIALTRLAAHTVIPDDPDVRADLDAALATTSASLRDIDDPDKRDWCLCHGLSGNADILLTAADALGDENARSSAEAVGDLGLQSIQRDHDPWPCNIGSEGEHPSLLLGLAGVGYFYLRLYDSNLTPSVLTPCGR